MTLKDDAKKIYTYAIKNVDPYLQTKYYIDLLLTGVDNVTVIAIGKAAVPMAKAAEDSLGSRISKALCVTKYGHTGSFKPIHFEIIEAAHPISDKNSVKALTAPVKTTRCLFCFRAERARLRKKAFCLFRSSRQSPASC